MRRIVLVALLACNRSDPAPKADPVASATVTTPATVTASAAVSVTASAPVAASVSASASASAAPPVVAPIGTAYDFDRSHICIPDTWTEGVTALAGPPRCGAVPGHHIWDGDVHRPCGPCAFSFDPDVTKHERAKHGNACCFRGSSPSGP